MTDDTMRVDGGSWETPLTLAELTMVGDARITRVKYPRGYYRMEGVAGYEYYKVVHGGMPVTSLELRQNDGSWKTWMVDDPLHWHGMREKVEDLNSGKLLVAGLGLGLMLHHLRRRDDISSITVVEIDPDVIALIAPTLERDARVEIVEADYYEYIARVGVERPDSILWDLAVGDHEETGPALFRARVLTEIAMPGTDLFCFGMKTRGPARRL